MKVTINATDKMIIASLLPQTESILIQMMARDIRRKTEITDKDREIIGLKPNPNGVGVAWDVDKVPETEIEVEFSETEIRMLQEQVKKLDETKKVSAAMLDTCLKIRDIKIGEKKDGGQE